MAQRTTEQRTYSSAIAVERAVDLMAALAERGDAGVTELAQHLGLGAGATHRVLVALTRKGVVEQDPVTGRYSLAWFLLSLATGVKGKASVRTLALPYMTALRDATRETITLFARSGFHRVCIEQVEGVEEFHWRAELGKVFPLYAGASGKLILAYMAPRDLEVYFETMPREPLTKYTKTDRKALEEELSRIREQGWSTSSQDRSLSVGGAAAPIFDPLGALQATLTISAPTWRMSDKDLIACVPSLTQAAGEISRHLGFSTTAGHD